jgi:HK97 family phage prohead protease
VSAEGTERLHQYWVHGEGAGKIAWGSPGDFDRCVRHLGKYIADPQGYCDLAHHAATGMWPAQHAAAIKKETGRSSVTVTQRAEMTAASINDLPDSDFAHIEPGGKKDSSGRTVPRSLRHYPVHDRAHASDALGRAQAQINGGDADAKRIARAALPKIRSAARKFGVDVSADDSGGVSRHAPADYMRLYPLEDIHIVRSADEKDGRIVEAYATVFGEPAEIHDHEGHYIETIDPAAFNKVLADVSRSRRGLAQIKVLYNHGRTIDGSASDKYSMPIGVPVEIRPEARGLLTRTRYSRTATGEEILALIEDQAITSQSFTGRIVRSDPQLRRGDRHRPDSAGQLRTVCRTELGLREYGPVLWPAYSGAEILGVRMSTPGSRAPDEIDEALAPDEEAAAGEPLARDDGEHSARYHQHALYRLRSVELRESKGLVW